MDSPVENEVNDSAGEATSPGGVLGVLRGLTTEKWLDDDACIEGPRHWEVIPDDTPRIDALLRGCSSARDRGRRQGQGQGQDRARDKDKPLPLTPSGFEAASSVGSRPSPNAGKRDHPLIADVLQLSGDPCLTESGNRAIMMKIHATRGGSSVGGGLPRECISLLGGAWSPRGAENVAALRALCRSVGLGACLRLSPRGGRGGGGEIIVVSEHDEKNAMFSEPDEEGGCGRWGRWPSCPGLVSKAEMDLAIREECAASASRPETPIKALRSMAALCGYSGPYPRRKTQIAGLILARRPPSRGAESEALLAGPAPS